MQYLSFAQISSFISYLWALFISRIKNLLNTLDPSNKLAYIFLVTGPLRQGTFQLTMEVED